MDTHDALLSIAIDLTASLAAGDRYARLLTAVRRALPCDAAAVLRLVGDELVPLAVHGLAPEVLGRRFPRREHPRLEVVVASAAPVHFPADSPLPDPFDGLLLADPGARTAVHACLGLPLLEEEHVVGVLTADALQPGAFDGLEERALRLLGALAGAAVAVAERISATERASSRPPTRTRVTPLVAQTSTAQRASPVRPVWIRRVLISHPLWWACCRWSRRGRSANGCVTLTKSAERAP